MKKLVFLIFLVINIKAIVFAQTSNDSPRIEIKYVDPDMTSKADVSCEKFESSFDKSEYRNYTVTDPFILNKLKENYQKITYYKEADDIDVRYKLSVYFTGKEKTPLVICMDNRSEAMINGQSVKSDKFFGLLKKVITLIPKEFSVKQ
ncbi:MAG: hypothetical protein ABI402_07515 [Ferruginibacter sp.]